MNPPGEPDSGSTEIDQVFHNLRVFHDVAKPIHNNYNRCGDLTVVGDGDGAFEKNFSQRKALCAGPRVQLGWRGSLLTTDPLSLEEALHAPNRVTHE